MKAKVFLFWMVFLIGVGYAAVPGKMSYEGRLTDSSLNPITAAKVVEFKIYDADTAGNLIWGPESQNITPDNQGVFSVLLGGISPITPEVFSGPARYLEISIAGETISPRTQIVSVGYFFMSALAQSVEDGSITRSKVASGQFVKQIVAGSGMTVSGDEGGGCGIVTLTATSTGGGSAVEINTGTGLIGGPITATGTISIDSTVVTASGNQTLTNKTLSTGSTWNGNKISEAYGGTNQNTYSTGDILYASSPNTLSKLSIGSNDQILKITGGVPSWGAAGGGGTVTQIDSGRGLLGGPITSFGTLSIDTAVVVTTSDAQTLTGKTISGASNTINNLNAGNISSGTLELARGGLGNDTSTATQGSVLYNDGSKWAALGPGTSGQILKTNGASANPAWTSAGSGTVTQVNTGTGLTGGPLSTTGTISIDTTVVPQLGAANTFTGTLTISGNTSFTAGKTITIGTTGTAPIAGIAAVAKNGSATVTTTAVTANSIILVTGQNGDDGGAYISARTAGTSFVITRPNSGTAGNINIGWLLIN